MNFFSLTKINHLTHEPKLLRQCDKSRRFGSVVRQAKPAGEAAVSLSVESTRAETEVRRIAYPKVNLA